MRYEKLLSLRPQMQPGARVASRLRRGATSRKEEMKKWLRDKKWSKKEKEKEEERGIEELERKDGRGVPLSFWTQFTPL